MSILGWVLPWCGAGINNVTEDIGSEINKELSVRYAVNSSRYIVMLPSRSGILIPVAHTVMSSAPLDRFYRSRHVSNVKS